MVDHNTSSRTTRPPTMNGILSGLRIVEGSAFVAAPLCGMTLAQMGADVIRFDLPGGGIDYRRWPMAKSVHPMKGDVGILGAYFND